MKRTQEPFDETKQSMKRHMPTKTSFDEQTSCHGAILNVPRDVTIFFFFCFVCVFDQYCGAYDVHIMCVKAPLHSGVERSERSVAQNGGL